MRPTDSMVSSRHAAARAEVCNGECLARAQQYLAEATEATAGLSSEQYKNVLKRFEILDHVSGTNMHKQSELALEQALALYESANGPRSPQVSATLMELAGIYRVHGDNESADYTAAWATEIMGETAQYASDFFSLVGMDEVGLEEQPGTD